MNHDRDTGSYADGINDPIGGTLSERIDRAFAHGNHVVPDDWARDVWRERTAAGGADAVRRLRRVSLLRRARVRLLGSAGGPARAGANAARRGPRGAASTAVAS